MFGVHMRWQNPPPPRPYASQIGAVSNVVLLVEGRPESTMKFR
jgi:hypothetical protein